MMLARCLMLIAACLGVQACRGFGHVFGYYWDGQRCQPDTACQCDSQHAEPLWRSLGECQQAHAHCQ